MHHSSLLVLAALPFLTHALPHQNQPTNDIVDNHNVFGPNRHHKDNSTQIILSPSGHAFNRKRVEAGEVICTSRPSSGGQRDFRIRGTGFEAGDFLEGKAITGNFTCATQDIKFQANKHRGYKLYGWELKGKVNDADCLDQAVNAWRKQARVKTRRDRGNPDPEAGNGTVVSDVLQAPAPQPVFPFTIKCSREGSADASGEGHYAPDPRPNNTVSSETGTYSSYIPLATPIHTDTLLQTDPIPTDPAEVMSIQTVDPTAVVSGASPTDVPIETPSAIPGAESPDSDLGGPSATGGAVLPVETGVAIAGDEE